jgi:hypothetical protein
MKQAAAGGPTLNRPQIDPRHLLAAELPGQAEARGYGLRLSATVYQATVSLTSTLPLVAWL